jgi:hypothetical protein
LAVSCRLAIKLGSGLEYNGGNSPSSGLVAILLGLRICNKLDVYGFSLRVSSFALVVPPDSFPSDADDAYKCGSSTELHWKVPQVSLLSTK